MATVAWYTWPINGQFLANSKTGDNMNDYVLRVPLNKKQRADFMKAFKKSGFSSMAEFVRFAVALRAQ